MISAGQKINIRCTDRQIRKILQRLRSNHGTVVADGGTARKVGRMFSRLRHLGALKMGYDRRNGETILYLSPYVSIEFDGEMVHFEW